MSEIEVGEYVRNKEGKIIKVGEHMSREEYLRKYDGEVGYALYVQNNIKKDDYARFNTGLICRVIGIKENNCNKKAIYYGIYEQDWFNSMAVENFSKDIIDLIEVGDYVNGYKVDDIKNRHLIIGDTTQVIEQIVDNEDIKTIVTKEQFKEMEYRV